MSSLSHRIIHIWQHRHGFLLPVILFMLVASVLAVWHINRFVAHTQAALSYRYPLDGQEGTLLHAARVLRSGEPLYQPLLPHQVMAAPYPPVHYVLLAALEYLTNPEEIVFNVTQRPIFQPGRLLSLTASVSVALLLALTVQRLGGSRIIGAVAGSLWLAFPSVQLWSTRIKADPLALAFTTVGLLAIAGYFTTERPAVCQRRVTPALVIAAVAFALAFFTKQTLFAAPLATTLTLLLTGHRKRSEPDTAAQPWKRLYQHLAPGLTFGTLYTLLVVITWISLDVITRGQYSFHVWGLHPPAWWTYGRLRKYIDLLLPAWPLMLLTGVSVGLTIRNELRWLVTLTQYRRHPVGTMHQLWLSDNLSATFMFCASYGLLGTAALVTVGTAGSHHNHLLEPQLALTLAGCSVAGRSLAQLHANVALQRLGLGLLALMLVLAQLWILRTRPAWYGGEFDLSEPAGERFVALIMSQPGEILADDVGLILAAGRMPRYNDPATMGPAIRSGLWDQRGLLADIAAQRFSLIILPFNIERFELDPMGRWSPECIAAIRQHYDLLYRDVMFSYIPGEHTGPFTAALHRSR